MAKCGVFGHLRRGHGVGREVIEVGRLDSPGLCHYVVRSLSGTLSAQRMGHGVSRGTRPAGMAHLAKDVPLGSYPSIRFKVLALFASKLNEETERFWDWSVCG